MKFFILLAIAALSHSAPLPESEEAETKEVKLVVCKAVEDIISLALKDNDEVGQKIKTKMVTRVKRAAQLFEDMINGKGNLTKEEKEDVLDKYLQIVDGATQIITEELALLRPETQKEIRIKRIDAYSKAKELIQRIKSRLSL